MNKLSGTDGYILIYDFINEGARFFPTYILFGFAVIGFYLLRSSSKNKEKDDKDTLGVSNNQKKKILGIFFMLFGLGFGFYTMGLGDYFETRAICKSKKYTQITGPISQLTIETSGKYSSMDFNLEQYTFHLSSNDISYYGCNFGDLSKARLSDSVVLRLSFYQKGGRNIILKAEQKE